MIYFIKTGQNRKMQAQSQAMTADELGNELHLNLHAALEAPLHPTEKQGF